MLISASRRQTWTLGAAATVLALAVPAAARAASPPFLDTLTTPTQIASTIPANGDVNPYGVAVVPRSTGTLQAGNVLVSNFNSASNLQGTGTTIVQVAPSGVVSQFAVIDPSQLPGACPGGVGLTTALVALPDGEVIVGSLPTSDGMSATAQAGCLIVLDSRGRVEETLAGGAINGPWDMTATTTGAVTTLFVTNVLNGTVAANGAVVNSGTVVRLKLLTVPGRPARLLDEDVIAAGFPERSDPAALVVGPTGVGLGRDGTLYVADTVANRIAAVPDALTRERPVGTGQTVSANGALNSPLGLAIAPNGDILTANAGDGNIVETTPSGPQVAVATVDSSGSPPGAGALFGLAIAPSGAGLYFVDDATNTLNLLH